MNCPGVQRLYAGWKELVEGIRGTLGGAKKIAMQYSPDCAIPYVAMVDAGTVELVRGLGTEIVTSANLVQFFEARWNQQQLDDHLEAGRGVDATRAAAFEHVSHELRRGERITEWQVKQFILDRFKVQGLFTDHGPDIAVNANASNPHYDPKEDRCSEIHKGDHLLMDMWAKLDKPEAVYYDITWIGFCGQVVPSANQNIFTIVRDARDTAIQSVVDAVASGRELFGYQVDDAARAHIESAGYGSYFFHRTGHSIGTDVHGTGANMDNLETHDVRKVIPWTCFSIEPGIYLPEFGVRSEVDMFVDEHKARVTGEVQERIVLV